MSQQSTGGQAPKRKRSLALPIVLAGAAASLILAVGMSPSVAAFTASITNNGDTAGTGTLTMQEANPAGTVACNSTDGGSVSTNSATCSTINKYGGNLAMTPGQTVSTTISITDTGTAPANTFTLTPGACSQAANGTVNGTATDLCSQMTVVVTSGSTTVFSGTLAAFNTGGAVNLLTKLSQAQIAAGASVPFTFAVTLPSSAGNTYAGLQAAQSLTWAFGA